MPDVREPALLLEFVRIGHRPEVREDAVLHPDDEHHRNSRPFAMCSVISVTLESSSS
jgi:hypothetical protein